MVPCSLHSRVRPEVHVFVSLLTLALAGIPNSRSEFSTLCHILRMLASCQGCAYCITRSKDSLETNWVLRRGNELAYPRVSLLLSSACLDYWSVLFDTIVSFDAAHGCGRIRIRIRAHARCARAPMRPYPPSLRIRTGMVCRDKFNHANPVYRSTGFSNLFYIIVAMSSSRYLYHTGINKAVM